MEISEIPHDPRPLGVPSGVCKMISEPIVRSTQTVLLSCVRISTMSEKDQNELPLEPHHIVVPSGAPK